MVRADMYLKGHFTGKTAISSSARGTDVPALIPPTPHPQNSLAFMFCGDEKPPCTYLFTPRKLWGFSTNAGLAIPAELAHGALCTSEGRPPMISPPTRAPRGVLHPLLLPFNSTTARPPL